MDSPGQPTNSRRDREPAGLKDIHQSYRAAAPYIALGLQLAATIVVMFLIGLWADNRFDTRPWLMIVGVVIGVGAGMYFFFRTVLHLGEREHKKRG